MHVWAVLCCYLKSNIKKGFENTLKRRNNLSLRKQREKQAHVIYPGKKEIADHIILQKVNTDSHSVHLISFRGKEQQRTRLLTGACSSQCNKIQWRANAKQDLNLCLTHANQDLNLCLTHANQDLNLCQTHANQDLIVAIKT
jgi:hypothetical protein